MALGPHYGDPLADRQVSELLAVVRAAEQRNERRGIFGGGLLQRGRKAAEEPEADPALAAGGTAQPVRKRNGLNGTNGTASGNGHAEPVRRPAAAIPSNTYDEAMTEALIASAQDTTRHYEQADARTATRPPPPPQVDMPPQTQQAAAAPPPPPPPQPVTARPVPPPPVQQAAPQGPVITAADAELAGIAIPAAWRTPDATGNTTARRSTTGPPAAAPPPPPVELPPIEAAPMPKEAPPPSITEQLAAALSGRMSTQAPNAGLARMQRGSFGLKPPASPSEAMAAALSDHVPAPAPAPPAAPPAPAAGNGQPSVGIVETLPDADVLRGLAERLEQALRRGNG